jgi:flavin-dependent dehydrogenase
MSIEFDVVVVGAGPGGFAAAKRCAEAGLNTLLIEKQRLPRDKVCVGGLNNAAQRLVKETFGNLPEGVLKRPPYVVGIQIHALGEEPITLEYGGLLVWRKDFNSSLNQAPRKSGA